MVFTLWDGIIGVLQSWYVLVLLKKIAKNCGRPASIGILPDYWWILVMYRTLERCMKVGAPILQEDVWPVDHDSWPTLHFVEFEKSIIFSSEVGSRQFGLKLHEHCSGTVQWRCLGVRWMQSRKSGLLTLISTWVRTDTPKSNDPNFPLQAAIHRCKSTPTQPGSEERWHCSVPQVREPWGVQRLQLGTTMPSWSGFH